MNKKFIWTADLLAEFIRDYGDRDGKVADLMEQFKESKQAKPEWEIMSLKDGNNIYNRAGDITYMWRAHTVDLEWALSRGYGIYSVKRLSDADEFTIGDKFTANAGCTLTIKRFDITEIGVQVLSNEFGMWLLQEIKKAPILTTQDGVDILDGCLHVCSLGKTTFEISECRADLIQKGHHDYYLYFSSRSKAEEYILMNKPLLSMNDLISGGIQNGSFYFNKIIVIAKEKLNKP